MEQRKTKIRERFQSFTTKYVHHAWIAIILLLGVMFYLNNSSILYYINPNLRFYLILPLFWLMTSSIAWWGWKYGLQEKPQFNKYLLFISAGTGIIHVSVSLISGLLFAFGKSPYTHNFPYVLGNILFIITYLTGLEFSRAYLIVRGTNTPNKKPLLVFLFTTIAYTIMVIPIGFYSKFTSPESSFIAIGQVVMPNFSRSMLATYLAWVGGPFAAVLYGASITLFEWLSPVLPKLSWMVTAFLETLTPMLLLLVVNQLVVQEEEKAIDSENEKQEKKKPPSYAWLGVATLGVTLIWFNMGLFGVRPYLVSGISMRPTLKAGDVVIIEAVEPKEIEVGDVILFRGSNVNILHRVIEIHPKEGELEFITKGDGLSTIDDPVSEAQVEGKMISSIPKVGWVAIGVRRALGYDKIPTP